MIVVDLHVEKGKAAHVPVVAATFFIFTHPTPPAQADAEINASIRLEQITPSNSVLLEIADRCEPPEVPIDNDGVCPW